MKVIITGSTGMIGGLILNECLQSSDVSEIINLTRKTSHSIQNPKLRNVVIDNFKNYDNKSALFENIDAAYFCIGVYTGQVTDELFREITVDYAVNFARMLKQHSPNARLCLLSGAGADRTEKSKTAFAKYKGMAENQISKLGLEFYAFRPGYIYPVTPRKEPNFLYKVFRWLYPILRIILSNSSIKSTDLATAMFLTGLSGGNKEIIENREITDMIKSIL